MFLLQQKIDLLVAKEEDHLSKIAGLEAAHGRLRKTLRTTESNLETYAMEAKQRIESLQNMLISTQHKLTAVGRRVSVGWGCVWLIIGGLQNWNKKVVVDWIATFLLSMPQKWQREGSLGTD